MQLSWNRKYQFRYFCFQSMNNALLLPVVPTADKRRMVKMSKKTWYLYNCQDSNWYIRYPFEVHIDIWNVETLDEYYYRFSYKSYAIKL